MSEKYYRPILKDGDHLVRSSQNPDRVRGQSRDANNKNPDIVEWEAIEIDKCYDYEPIAYVDRQVQLSPEEEKISQAIGEALAAGTAWMVENVVSPWWKRSAWPWIKEKSRNAVDALRSRGNIKAEKTNNCSNNEAEKQNYELETVSAKIEQAFEQVYIDMAPEEAKIHLMKIVFHILEIANEIRIMSNAQIRRTDESEAQFAERIHATEQYLTEKVAISIDKLLLEQTQQLDMKTSKELFGLFGGGVVINDEYVPVEHTKVFEAIVAQTDKSLNGDRAQI